MQHSKPKTLIDNLGGLDVRIDSKNLSPDERAKRIISDLATSMAPVGNSYEGSVVLHYYMGSPILGTLNQSTQASVMIHIMGLDNISEQFASFSIADAALKMRQFYHPEYKKKTLDRRDLRDKA